MGWCVCGGGGCRMLEVWCLGTYVYCQVSKHPPPLFHPGGHISPSPFKYYQALTIRGSSRTPDGGGRSLYSIFSCCCTDQGHRQYVMRVTDIFKNRCAPGHGCLHACTTVPYRAHWCSSHQLALQVPKWFRLAGWSGGCGIFIHVYICTLYSCTRTSTWKQRWRRKERERERNGQEEIYSLLEGNPQEREEQSSLAKSPPYRFPPHLLKGQWHHFKSVWH